MWNPFHKHTLMIQATSSHGDVIVRCTRCKEEWTAYKSGVYIHGVAYTGSKGLSKCCKAATSTYSGGEGTSFYICIRCEKPCDTL